MTRISLIFTNANPKPLDGPLDLGVESKLNGKDCILTFSNARTVVLFLMEGSIHPVFGEIGPKGENRAKFRNLSE
jgi:hypothetical protein